MPCKKSNVKNNSIGKGDGRKLSPFLLYMMVEALPILLRIFFWWAVTSLILGFVRPVYVLWFLDRFNRLKVLKVYGTLSLLFFVLGIVLDCLL